jgi:hypothetical protein
MKPSLACVPALATLLWSLPARPLAQGPAPGGPAGPMREQSRGGGAPVPGTAADFTAAITLSNALLDFTLEPDALTAKGVAINVLVKHSPQTPGIAGSAPVWPLRIGGLRHWRVELLPRPLSHPIHQLDPGDEHPQSTVYVTPQDAQQVKVDVDLSSDPKRVTF